jgi:uncharacterized delta-60 repeat protein
LCLFVLAGIGMYAGVLDAAPGDLDPGFGDHGRVQLPFDGGFDDWVPGAGPAIIRQPDGRVLVARTERRAGSDPSDSEVAVARLQIDGTLDPEFGTGGVVRLRFRAGEAAGAGGLALLPDGRLLVVGYSIKAWLYNGEWQYPDLDTGLALVRTDGSLDPDGFGNGGRMALDLSESGRTDHGISAVALDDGHIVVAGTAESESGTRFVMLRMTTQGSVDPSFGDHDGLAWTGSITSLSGFHRTAGGQFVACGTSYAGPTAEGRIVRFDSAGDLVGETNLASAGIESLTACAPQMDGSVVFGGLGRAGTWLGQVDADGQLNPAFGEQSGRTPIDCVSCAVWDRLGYSRIPTDIAVLADGRLTVALDGNGWGHLALRSFAPDGRTDTGSAPSLTDRFYDMGWRELPPSAGAAKLLPTQEGGQLAVVAGWASTTVIRLKASDGPGASVIGLLGDFQQRSESDSRSLLACRSGSIDGVVSANFATRDDTAQSPDDYVPASGLLTWGDGETGCKAIPITVKVDDRSEPTESIWVELTDTVGAGLAMDKARLFIADVQSPGPEPEPTPGGDSNRGGGGAAGSGLLMLLAALACLRRLAQLAVARRRQSRVPLRGMRIACLALALVLTTVAGPVVADGWNFDSRQAPSLLVGTWRVTTTPYNCVTGQVFPQFARPSLMTFGAGGTIVEGSANPDFQPGQRSSGHGYWEREGRMTFHAVFEAFILFTSVVTPPAVPRYVRGTSRLDHGIEIKDVDHWSSYASVTFLDVAGTPVPPSGCAQATAERMR